MLQYTKSAFSSQNVVSQQSGNQKGKI